MSVESQVSLFSEPFVPEPVPEVTSDARQAWERLIDAVEHLVRSDDSAGIRNRAQQILAWLDETPSGELSAPDGIIRIKFSGIRRDINQICEAKTFERRLYYSKRLLKGLSEVRTSAVNDINLNRWQEYEDVLTDSLWIIDKRDSSGVHSAGYWGNFIPQIPNQLMTRYTKQGDWVLDPFSGMGTTLIESQRLGRNGIGIELQSEVAKKSRDLISSEPNLLDVTSEVVTADSTTVDLAAELERFGVSSVQLVVMHPPYFDIVKFSEDSRDLSNTTSLDHFLEKMGQVVDNCAPFLDKGRFLALVISDKYEGGEWIPLGFRTMETITRRGFKLKSIVVKNFEDTTGKRNQKELWRYRALSGGFYVFKHEYLFILEKR